MQKGTVVHVKQLVIVDKNPGEEQLKALIADHLQQNHYRVDAAEYLKVEVYWESIFKKTHRIASLEKQRGDGLSESVIRFYAKGLKSYGSFLSGQ